MKKKLTSEQRKFLNHLLSNNEMLLYIGEINRWNPYDYLGRSIKDIIKDGEYGPVTAQNLMDVRHEYIKIMNSPELKTRFGIKN